jgi:hypothetical protein
LADAVQRLPNFFSMRTSSQFDESRSFDEGAWKSLPDDESLHITATNKTTVLFRGGKEVVEKVKNPKPGDRALVTEGTFGPILGIVISSLTKGRNQLAWSRWEGSAAAPVAVFHYVAAGSTQLFKVGFCCTAESRGTVPYEKWTAFHGEIAIDAASGAVLRLTVQSDLDPKLPVTRSEIMVEYAPVDLGGKMDVCPTRSVSIGRQRTTWVLHEWGEAFGVYGHYESLMNDISFSDYHLFRSNVTILPDYDPAPQ